jgi:hypothetical protein
MLLEIQRLTLSQREEMEKKLQFAPRPGTGTAGKGVKLKTNHFAVLCTFKIRLLAFHRGILFIMTSTSALKCQRV